MEQETQIWIVSGRTRHIWTIPVSVVWTTTKRCLVRPAVVLMGIQVLEIERVLNRNGRRKGGQWLFTDLKLNRIANQTSGGDPEQYLSWTVRMLTADKQPIDNEDTKGFLDDFYLRTPQMLGREELSVFWYLLCQHMAHWLINKEQPVDMIRWKLHPSMFRGNWKPELLHKIRIRLIQEKHKRGAQELRRNAVSMPYEVFANKMENRGYARMLRHDMFLAFDCAGGFCYRRIELEITDKWWDTIRNVEAQRLTATNPESYAKQIRLSTQRQIRKHMRLFQQFVAEVVCPYAATRISGSGEPIFVRSTRKDVSGGQGYNVFLGRLVECRSNRKSAMPENLPAPNGKVSALPAVQSDPENVRDSGPGSDGVSVLHAGEKLPERQLLGVGTGA